VLNGINDKTLAGRQCITAFRQLLEDPILEDPDPGGK
jgi:hypothetical protein